ncbi:hypothetical protein FIV42_00575 [Persicimonas caeni]|uniref:Uncharacterized protein n=1 Tax=Persicimonas caeni TaxID=2292766 RepID=A0A4Y6PM30_PERCE|nr:hypothetical protein [Persicimonas caeni]QDG49279.1 hypothetical protein FIV42_00575 [Persicimonas caeni]QED30500.1 hypothetical protein FRD00_00570 [Persicimonas caeni]
MSENDQRPRISAEDRRLLELEGERRELYAEWDELVRKGAVRMPKRLERKLEDNRAARRPLQYDRTGNFRADRRHLLKGCGLDLSLLDNDEVES